MTQLDSFSDEQMRTLINLEQRYQVWIDAERALAAMPYNLRRKDVGPYSYLYEETDRRGNGTTIGKWTPEAEAQIAAYRAEKTETRARIASSAATLDESARLYRALRLPVLANEVGAILREADRRRLLGSHLLVVGTNAMAAYAIEAVARFRDVPQETEDFDLAWSATELPTDERSVWDMLKAVDPTFTVNTERPFQARNARTYEVELLVSPSRAATLGRKDQPRPIPLPEQEWLLLGTPVDHVVVCRDASPARIVAPDPRWFALQKLWMAGQAKRNPLKRPKDAKQGNALLDAIWLAMPQYPLDAAFEASVPPELVAFYAAWLARPKPEAVRHW